jgi:hypothetical protein
MEGEFAAHIAAAEIPPGLKSAFPGYYQHFEAMRPSLPLRYQHRFHYWLGQILAQAADPTIHSKVTEIGRSGSQ